MKQILLTFLIALSTVFCSFIKPKQFPIFNYQTIKGKEINNNYFKVKKTIVIMAHLGCPPAMLLFKDLEDIDTTQYQFLLVLENTKMQLQEFNADEKNMWSKLRKYFELKPIMMDAIAECDVPNLKYDGNDVIVAGQCRKLAKKLKSYSSPMIIYVNQNGEIMKKIDGYSSSNDKSSRVKLLLNGEF
jgi:thioredoxin-related protein